MKNILLFTIILFLPFQGTWAQGNTYAGLKESLDGGYYEATGGILYFLYEEKYEVPAGSILSYSIFDKNRNVIAEVTNNNVTPSNAPTPRIVFGKNKIELDLNPFTLSSGQYYFLEVMNSKKEKLFLKFKFP